MIQVYIENEQGVNAFLKKGEYTEIRDIKFQQSGDIFHIMVIYDDGKPTEKQKREKFTNPVISKEEAIDRMYPSWADNGHPSFLTQGKSLSDTVVADRYAMESISGTIIINNREEAKTYIITYLDKEQLEWSEIFQSKVIKLAEFFRIDMGKLSFSTNGKGTKKFYWENR